MVSAIEWISDNRGVYDGKWDNVLLLTLGLEGYIKVFEIIARGNVPKVNTINSVMHGYIIYEEFVS